MESGQFVGEGNGVGAGADDGADGEGAIGMTTTNFPDINVGFFVWLRLVGLI